MSALEFGAELVPALYARYGSDLAPLERFEP